MKKDPRVFYVLRGILFCLTLFLWGCETTSTFSLESPPSLEKGKEAFKLGNYEEAYQQLAPLAQQGVPEAQYALGYMAYYGLGMGKNENMARVWMEKAASGEYTPAQEALKNFSPTLPGKPPEKKEASYSLQLSGSHQKEPLEALVKQYSLPHTRIIKTALNQEPWYILLMGEYDSVDSALKAKTALQTQIPSLHPWIRKVMGQALL